jgi:hypothetical protein
MVLQETSSRAAPVKERMNMDLEDLIVLAGLGAGRDCYAEGTAAVGRRPCSPEGDCGSDWQQYIFEQTVAQCEAQERLAQNRIEQTQIDPTDPEFEDLIDEDAALQQDIWTRDDVLQPPGGDEDGDDLTVTTCTVDDVCNPADPECWDADACRAAGRTPPGDEVPDTTECSPADICNPASPCWDEEACKGWRTPPEDPPRQTPPARTPPTSVVGVTPNSKWWKKVNEGWAYQIHTGATLCTIAVTYLGSCGRAPEIYAYQSAAFRKKWKADAIPVGTLVLATPGMVEKARALGLIPATETGVGWPYVAGGVAVVTVVGVLLYALSK